MPRFLRSMLRAETAVIVLVLGSVVGIGGFVHSTMTQVRQGLPAEVLGQQADIAQVLYDLANLVRAVEIARLDSRPQTIDTAVARLAVATNRIQHLRLSYNFDNLIGASAVHAVVNPAVQDMRRWLIDGLYDYPPSHPAIMTLVHRRAEEAHRQVGELFLEANVASMQLLDNEAGRIEWFRISMISYLAVFALLATGVVVLFVLQRNARMRLDVERNRLGDSIESINEGFALFDSDDRLLVCNGRFRELHGIEATRVCRGTPFARLCALVFHVSAHPDDDRLRQQIKDRIDRHRNPGQPFEIVSEDGRCIRIGERRTREGGTVGIYTDITDLRRVEARLRHLSVHDPLTGLMNRGAFGEPAFKTLAQRAAGPGAVRTSGVQSGPVQAVERDVRTPNRG